MLKVIILGLLAVFASNSWCSPSIKQYLVTFKESADLEYNDEKLWQFYRQSGSNDISMESFFGESNDNLRFNIQGLYIMDKLQATAEKSHSKFMESSPSLVIKKKYYISNSLLVECTSDVADNLLKSHSDVILEVSEIKPFRVSHVTGIRLMEQSKVAVKESAIPPIANQWNIERIGSPKVWSGLNVTGRGMVFASADTGVEFDHPILFRNYRGFKDSDGSVDHSYNWYDGVTQDIGSGYMKCPINSPAPCDDSGHGTHTTSTSVGISGYGVAPDAKWIACRNMDRGFGSTEFYLNCLQFFLAPFDKNGANPNPALRPHAVDNSYGCPKSEGCAPNAFARAVKALRSAGVFMAVSAGNSGSQCSTISDPPSYESAVITVAALGFRSNSIAFYSSRGPVQVTGYLNVTKPDISAPGSSVKAAFPPHSYATLSGTSMAAPHVAGAALLIGNACPWTRRSVKSIQFYITSRAQPLYASSGILCGRDNSSSVPNNVYGYGAINVYNSILACLKDTTQP